MPSRAVVARELADTFKTLAHPDRIRLIEELRGGEKDVKSLAQALDLPATRVSQHLGLLRIHRLVSDRRDGRRQLYSLSQPDLADWIVSALGFLTLRSGGLDAGKIEAARQLWTGHAATVHRS